MGKTFVDLSALCATKFGRNLYEDVLAMAREPGQTEEAVLAHMRQAVADENERRATQGIRTIEVAGLAA